MKYPRVLACATLIVALVSAAGAQNSKPTAEVIIAPFTVESENGDALRAQSDRCFERFAAALALKGVRIARDPQLSAKNLQSAPASWAVLGQLTRRNEQFELELRLLEVKSGEELRSYFNTDKDPQVACSAAEKAAERIATFVREQTNPEPDK